MPILAIVHSPAQGGSAWNLSNTGPEVSEEKPFEIINIFFHTNVWGPYKCIQKQTWPRCKKVKCQCMTINLANLVDRLFQMIYAQIQPQAILGFRFSYWFPYTLAYSWISHEYSSLFIIAINLIFMFSLLCIDWVGSLYANRIFMCLCIKSSIGTQGEVS